MSRKRIKISIDLWGTLIKGNEDFSVAKVAMTKIYFPHLSTEDILRCYKETKTEFNNIVENTGVQLEETSIFQLLLNKLNGRYNEFSHKDQFIKEYQKLSIEIPPKFYSHATPIILNLLSKDYDLVLCSNTMLINGNSLRKILENMGVANLFKMMVFSDILKVAKPNPKMYFNSDLHIGDNEVTDGIGAILADSFPIIINSNQLTIEHAYHIITKRK